MNRNAATQELTRIYKQHPLQSAAFAVWQPISQFANLTVSQVRKSTVPQVRARPLGANLGLTNRQTHEMRRAEI